MRAIIPYDGAAIRVLGILKIAWDLNHNNGTTTSIVVDVDGPAYDRLMDLVQRLIDLQFACMEAAQEERHGWQLELPLEGEG